MLGIIAGRLLRPLSFHSPKRRARPLKSSLFPATRIRQTKSTHLAQVRQFGLRIGKIKSVLRMVCADFFGNSRLLFAHMLPRGM